MTGSAHHNHRHRRRRCRIRRMMLAPIILLAVAGAAVLAGCSDDESAAPARSVSATTPHARSQGTLLAQPSRSIWMERAPLLDPNSETAVAELNGRIYVIGGYPSTRVYVATVQVYDAQTDRWSYTTPVPQPLHHTMAAAVNGKLYVIGGAISTSGAAYQVLLRITI